MAKGTVSNSMVLASKVDLPLEVLCCKYTPNKDCYLVGCTDGIVRSYKTGSGEFVSTMGEKGAENISKPITAIDFKPVRKNQHDDCLVISAATTGQVKLWKWDKGVLVKKCIEDRQTLGVKFHPEQAKFATTGSNSEIYIYDLETLKRIQSFVASPALDKVDGHTSRVYCVVFHPIEQNEFISGGWDDTVQFWDIRQQYSTRYITGAHICGEGIDIAHTGTELLTCSYQEKNPLQLWDYATGSLILDLDPGTHHCRLYCGKWITTDCIATGGTDPSIARVVNLKSFTTVSSFRSHNQGGIYSIDNKDLPGPKTKDDTYQRLLFCSGPQVMEVDFRC